jgi:hypothetical protein
MPELPRKLFIILCNSFTVLVLISNFLLNICYDIEALKDSHYCEAGNFLGAAVVFTFAGNLVESAARSH